MLVVVSIVMILCTLIIATVVNALSELRAAGGASGVAGFVRDVQVHAVQSGHVLAIRADRITSGAGDPPFWRLTAWEFRTDADALLKNTRGDSANPNDWPQATLPAVSFDLDPNQDLLITQLAPSAPDSLVLGSIVILPDGTANKDVRFNVFDVSRAKSGATDGVTDVLVQHATGRVYLSDARYQYNP